MGLLDQLTQFDVLFAQMSGQAAAVIGSEPITISGSPFPSPLTVSANWVMSGRTEDLTIAGRRVSYRVKVVVSAAEFPTDEPRQGQIVTRVKDGSTYRISREVVKTESDATFHLILDSVHK